MRGKPEEETLTKYKNPKAKWPSNTIGDAQIFFQEEKNTRKI